jgi:hypothetical protein
MVCRAEFRHIAEWFRIREQKLWDGQVDTDPASGRLDFPFDEAETEFREGLLEWPPSR